MDGEELVEKKKQEEDIVASEEATPTAEDLEIPKEIAEIIDKLPPEEGKKVIRSFQLSMGSFQGMISEQSPVLKKLNEEHITKIIEISEKSDEREYKFAMWSKVYTLIFTVVSIGVFIFLTLYLAQNNSTIYMDIIKVLFGFLGGFGVGKTYKGLKK